MNKIQKFSIQTLPAFIQATYEIGYQNHTNIETSVKGFKNKVVENYLGITSSCAICRFRNLYVVRY